MAVTISSTVTKGQTPTATTSTSASAITVASGQSLILGVVTDGTSKTVTSAVFNSGAQSFSLVDAQNVSTTCRCEVWEIASPTAGSGTVTVNLSATALHAFIAAVVDGADAGASYRDAATKTSATASSTPSLTVTSATNDLAIAFFGNINTNSTATADASPVSQVAVITSGTGASNVRMWLLQETGAASTSPSGTYGGTRDWAAVGFNLNVLPTGGYVPGLDRRRRTQAMVAWMKRGNSDVIR